MRHLSQPHSSSASWAAALLGFLTLEMVITSCAGSENDVGARESDTDGGSASDATADANDGACEGDCDACGSSDGLPCSDVEWTVVNTNHPGGVGLSSVWGSGPNDVWAVAAAGSAIHWDGKDWTPVPVATGWSLQAIWGTGPNDVWTVSSPNLIFHTTGFANGTAQWSPVTPIWDSSNSSDQGRRLLRTIWGTSPNDIWIGGDSSLERPPSYVRESGWRSIITDGGTGWAPISIFANHQIKAIWGSGPGDIWLVGSQGIGISFAAHTNGVAAADGGLPVWTEIDTQSLPILHAVWGSGPGDVWTVGDYGTIRHFVAGAEVWSVVDSPTTESLRGLWGAGPDDIWAVGENGTILHYDGTAWRTSTGAFPPGKKPHLFSVWGSGPSDVWAVGSGVVLHFSGSKSGARGANR